MIYIYVYIYIISLYTYMYIYIHMYVLYMGNAGSGPHGKTEVPPCGGPPFTEWPPFWSPGAPQEVRGA